jgi:hypothetical protein
MAAGVIGRFTFGPRKQEADPCLSALGSSIATLSFSWRATMFLHPFTSGQICCHFAVSGTSVLQSAVIHHLVEAQGNCHREAYRSFATPLIQLAFREAQGADHQSPSRTSDLHRGLPNCL